MALWLIFFKVSWVPLFLKFRFMGPIRYIEWSSILCFFNFTFVVNSKLHFWQIFGLPLPLIVMINYHPPSTPTCHLSFCPHFGHIVWPSQI